jgi:hypothetical protein
MLTSLALVLALAGSARADVPFDQLLPGDTVFLLRVADFRDLRARWDESQRGKLLADPALKPFVDSIVEAFDEIGAEFQKQAGLSAREVLELLYGELAVAVRAPQKDEVQPRVVLLVNVGPHADKTRELLDRLGNKLVEAGYARTSREVHGTALTALRPADKKADDAADGAGSPIVWGLREGVLIAGSDQDSLAELLGRWDGGAEGTLARKESYRRVAERTGDDAPVQFYADFAALFAFAVQEVPGLPGGGDQAGQAMKMLGFDTLRAVGGSAAFGQGEYDSVVKVLVHYETPPRGLVRVLHMKPSELTPEAWVPPDVASYMTLNFSLPDLYAAFDEIVNKFQPGGISGLAGTLLATQGILLDVKREVVTPLGSRLTVITDYADVADMATERTLMAFALNDSKTAAATLTKLAGLAGSAFKRRDFQGQAIYEFTAPNLADPGAVDAEETPPWGLAVAAGGVFLASDVKLLEKVLLQAAGKRDNLATTAGYKAVIPHLPAQSAGIGFTRLDLEYRALYSAIKDGLFADALDAMIPFGSETLQKFADALDGSKLPEFDVIARYLGPQGMYMTADDDGLLIIQFELRKEP